MKPYGLPRNDDVAHPDLADIKEYGRPGRVGNLPGKGGDVRSHFRNPASKAATRRVYKRRARADGKALAKEEG